ncbi:ABC transporter substrate-binding protein [Campylobacter geochelonis]|uniref:ABC transporter substrate-binding protein n=1 Tax=Campylobacter geochelonis TaxID=1780362 RepID=UPI000770B5E8|nr:ABC transporter substrate-binding protein [Campylobacter geochelonis]CZE45829.1 Receptor family ligand binding region [Campylobacter geochelonis]
MLLSNLFALDLTLISSLPLSGFNKGVGQRIKNGANLYFDDYNAKNVNKINFVVYDDASNQDKFKHNILTHISGASAVFMPVDTVDIRQIVPEILSNKLVVFSPVSGANFLDFKVFECVINTRATFEFEMESLVDYFYTKNLKKISLVYQSGEHGEEAYNSLAQALDKRGLKIYSSISYKKNSNVTEPILENIVQEDSDVVIFALLNDTAVDIVSKLEDFNVGSKFVFLGDADLTNLKKPWRIFISTFTPSFNNSKNLANLYKKLAMQKNLKPNELSYAAFLNAFLISKVFEETKFNAHSKKNFINKAKKVIDKYKFFNTNYIIKFDENTSGKIVYQRTKP